jgi:hypothetical protein
MLSTGRSKIGLDNAAFAGRIRTPRAMAAPSPGRRVPGAASSSHRDVTMTDISQRNRPASVSPSRNRRVLPPSGTVTVVSQKRDAISDILVSPVHTKAVTQLELIAAQPFAVPARAKQQSSRVLRRQAFRQQKLPIVAQHTDLSPVAEQALPSLQKRHMHLPRLSLRQSPLQAGLVIMAMIVFVLGIGVSVQTFMTNNAASAQVAALSQEVDKQSAQALAKSGQKTATSAGSTSSVPVPSVIKPSTHSVSAYLVAPDAPRYLNIPELGVHARVLSTGLLPSGALGTPSNVYDTDWYNASAKPGQPGAVLIDGHVSSWTSHGVFYGIKNLRPGDGIQVVRGDGAVISYRVVRSQTFAEGAVDMTSAVTPVTAGKPGLNLITCTGKVKPGTSEFDERVIVYAEQI